MDEIMDTACRNFIQLAPNAAPILLNSVKFYCIGPQCRSDCIEFSRFNCIGPQFRSDCIEFSKFYLIGPNSDPIALNSVNFYWIRCAAVQYTHVAKAFVLKSPLPKFSPLAVFFESRKASKMNRATWDQCYDFLHIFAEKFGGKNGVFDSKES
jgi:hypothetical protein